jgi:hypothetical protein
MSCIFICFSIFLVIILYATLCRSQTVYLRSAGSTRPTPEIFRSGFNKYNQKRNNFQIKNSLRFRTNRPKQTKQDIRHLKNI